ncbi:MAG TPA: retroviral-like aspartic protease family protein [Thermoplasmata archaeon]|nr:retroviral-like aspartic protease family protein [Thermoplasmata archaeon]
MDTFRVPVRVFSLAVPAVGRELEMLVDTGATQSIVPREILEALRVPVDRRQKFHLANGEPVDRDEGWVGFRCQGRNAYTLAVFGDPQDATVPGALTLEELGLEVDPQERTRKPAVAWLLAV